MRTAHSNGIAMHFLTSTFCKDFSNSYASWKKFYVFLSLIVKRLILVNINLPPHRPSAHRQQLPALLRLYVLKLILVFSSALALIVRSTLLLEYAPHKNTETEKNLDMQFSPANFVCNANIIVSRINGKKTSFAKDAHRTHTHTHAHSLNRPNRSRQRKSIYFSLSKINIGNRVCAPIAISMGFSMSAMKTFRPQKA